MRGLWTLGGNSRNTTLLYTGRSQVVSEKREATRHVLPFQCADTSFYALQWARVISAALRKAEPDTMGKSSADFILFVIFLSSGRFLTHSAADNVYKQNSENHMNTHTKNSSFQQTVIDKQLAESSSCSRGLWCAFETYVPKNKT